jgi:phosphoribosylamine-glycine ligase
VKLEIRKEFSATVVLASKGYPGDYVKGIEIKIGALPESVSKYT